MGAVIGELLPLAIGVAISPIPIIAVILMLLAPRAGGASKGFGAGWVLGVLGATLVVVAVARAAGIGGSSANPSTGASWVRAVVGALLLALGARQWRGRPRSGEQPELPEWMRMVDRITPAKAAGLGFVLAAVNPKNLAMCVAAGVAVGGGHLGWWPAFGSVLVFTALAVSTVVVPVVGYAVARQRMLGPLSQLRGWLERHNAAVMAVLFAVIGVTVLGQGVGGLT